MNKDIQKPSPMEAALKFVNQYFPDCQAALLAGSVVRAEATETSDLDIVIFDNSIQTSYRESFIEFGWPIEAFIHNLKSYKYIFDLDYKNARPSMQRMILEGIVLKDTNVLANLKLEAKKILEQGPEEWTEETITIKRYFLTDTLEDFIGNRDRAEGICIAGTLANLLHEFVLRTNRKWIGSSKWMMRALKQFDAHFASSFAEAFDTYYKDDNKSKVIDLTDSVLAAHGGRFFAGFTHGRNNNN